MKNARKKLETPVAPAMPSKNNQNCGNGDKSNKANQNLCVFWKSVNLQDCVWENFLPNHHEDHIAGKGDKSLQHYNLVHKFMPVHQAMKITRSKGSGGQGM